MVLQYHKGPDGPYYVRPRYRPEDYLIDANALRAIENERGGHLNVDRLIGLRDGPFVGWEEVGRLDRDGKRWVRLRQTDADYAVDVEVMEIELGEVVPVDPLISYKLALEADPERPYPVIYE